MSNRKGPAEREKSCKLREDQEEKVVDEDKLKLRPSPASLSLRDSGIPVIFRAGQHALGGKSFVVWRVPDI